MRYVELTVCWLLELNPSQLDRVLCSWSSRLSGMIMVKWTKGMRYVELTVCWLLELNPGQLDRVLCSWSSRLSGMIMVKWTV